MNIKRIFLTFFLIVFILPFDSTGRASSRHGGRIVLATTSDPRSFNDILAKETSTTLVTGFIFEGLTKTNARTAQVEPHLAQSWDVTDDGLEWTFYLRKDVLWQDGQPFTADDVVFTFNELIFNDDIPSSARDIFTLDGQPIEVIKIDDDTVRFVLPVKFAPFLRGMGQSILPRHKLANFVKNKVFNSSWGINTNPRDIVGTGPFQLVKYDPGQRLVFEKNPSYWKKSEEGEALPYIDKVIYLIVPNADVQILKFLEGSTDSYGVRGLDYPFLKPLEHEKDFTVYDLGPDMGSQFLFFNQNTRLHPETKKPYLPVHKQKWFTNLNFRRAVAHAIDKDQIIAIVKNGLGYKQHSPLGPGSGFFHNPNVRKYPFDLDSARQLLAEEGFLDRDGDGWLEDSEGHRLEFNLATNAGGTERIDIAAIIRSDLEKLGIKINFQALEFNTLVSQINASFDWDAIILGLTGGIEPHFGQNVWKSSGQLHMWNPRQDKPETEWEKRIDALFDQGVKELNEDKRKKIYDEFQQIVSEKVPLIYTVLSARLSAVRNKFGNLDPTNYGGVFHNLEEIYILEKYR